MSDPISDEDAQRWHKRFAVDCNNRAWELSVRPRSAAEDRELLDRAHAAACHWGQIGTELHRMRATTLLAEAHALLGMGPSALAYATEIRAYFLGRDTPDWELALTHTVYAHAAHAAGRIAEHRTAHASAAAALAAIADAEDREIVAKTFDQVPLPTP